jgi:hypothetical protein
VHPEAAHPKKSRSSPGSCRSGLRSGLRRGCLLALCSFRKPLISRQSLRPVTQSA